MRTLRLLLILTALLLLMLSSAIWLARRPQPDTSYLFCQPRGESPLVVPDPETRITCTGPDGSGLHLATLPAWTYAIVSDPVHERHVFWTGETVHDLELYYQPGIVRPRQVPGPKLSMQPLALSSQGMLAYRRSEGPQGVSIYVGAIGEADVRRVAVTGPINLRVAWTGDGEWLVFTNNHYGPNSRLEGALYRVRPDGSGLERIAETDGQIADLAVSPTGDEIAIAVLEPDQPAVWRLALDGGNRQRVQSGDAAIWVLDGQFIAFRPPAPPDDTVTAAIHHSLTAPLASNGNTYTPDYYRDFRWAPDGEWVVFLAEVSGARAVMRARTDRVQVESLSELGTNYIMPYWVHLPAAQGFPWARLGLSVVLGLAGLGLGLVNRPRTG